MILLDNVSVQDRDLLARLTQYFGSFDVRIKEGQGWLIFNADRSRAHRITRFILDRLAERRPFISYYYVPWRDFALNAYMLRVELPIKPVPPPPDAGADAPDRAAIEHDIAGRVSRDQLYQMRFADVLLVSGLAPAHQHELDHVDAVLADRLTRRLPTIVLTPRAPHDLMRDFLAQTGGGAVWQRFYDGMYASSLLAL